MSRPTIHGRSAPGFEPVERAFRRHFEHRLEIGAAVSIFQRGKCVVDLWGGLADRDQGRPWQHDTRAVLFSVTKAMTAAAFHLLAERGLFAWDDPVAKYWPGFARNGKEGISIELLLSHRAGLAALDTRIRLDACFAWPTAPHIIEALESQRPLWPPGSDQGYHALTYGMYAGELFWRITGERIGSFLERELFVPVGSDVRLGTDDATQALCATLSPPSDAARAARMARAAVLAPRSPEGGIARDLARRDGLGRGAFGNPTTGPARVRAYDTPEARRAELPWASATGSARGVARAMLPFALGGEVDGHRYLRAESIAPLHERAGWAENDRVLHKALGWTRGFLKEEAGVFGPHRECFGHSGVGGALVWVDPVRQLSFGYVPNALDWRVRSPRTVALVEAMYASPAVNG